MKKLFIVLLFFFIIHSSFGQLFNYDLKELNDRSITCAKKILKKKCRKDRHWRKFGSPRRQFGKIDVDSLQYLPVTLFYISKKAIAYDSTKNIIAYLQYKKRHPVLGFVTYRGNNFEGLLDWSSWIHGDLHLDCAYFTIHNSSFFDKEPLLIGIEYLKKQNRQIEFLFGVKYFVSSLWFVEKEQVYVLNLNDMQIYDPDEFIKIKCYKGFVKDIAEGGQIQCNME